MLGFDLNFQDGGIHLPQLDLWLDPRVVQRDSQLVFISRPDHFASHREVILSEASAAITPASGTLEVKKHILAFDQPFAPPNVPIPFEITLLPAGGIPGATMAWVFDGKKSLLYTGSFKLTAGKHGEHCRPRPSNILILETVYGLPIYRFPPRGEVIQDVVRFCQETLEKKEIPVLFGNCSGVVEDIVRELACTSIPVVFLDAIHRFSIPYLPGHVVIGPESFNSSLDVKNLGKTRTALLSGSAMAANSKEESGVDIAFPLSDHPDFSELLQMVQLVNPSKIYTVHGFASDFSRTLREMGYDAQDLTEPNQLDLGIQMVRRQSINRISNSEVTCHDAFEPLIPAITSFEIFAQTCALISANTRKTEKIQLLATYMRQLPSGELSHTATWFTGTPFVSSQNRTLQLGWAIIRDALCLAGEIDHSQFGRTYLNHSELGECASEILATKFRPQHFPSLLRIHELFLQLHAAKGPTEKKPLLRKAFLEASPLAAKFLVKILTGDLRIGLKEGLVEESLAQAFDCSLEAVKNANLLLGDIGQTATMARDGRLESVSIVPFRPVRYMLASPGETSREIWSRIASWQTERENDSPLPLWTVSPAEGWSEAKYDGVRAQIHKVGSHVEIYSRDLKVITPAFPEIANRIRGLSQNLILDGEIIAMRGERVLSYSDLQKRLGRRETDFFLSEEIPVQFMAFDLLWLDSNSLLRDPLWARRQSLGALAQNAFRVSKISSVRNAEQIENAFNAAKASGCEGVMIKDPSSIYTPGRRGMSWLQYKKNFITLNCVVVGAEYGHGKRNSMLSVYTIALRDEISGELKAVGKTFVGLTDQEITFLTEHFSENRLAQMGRFIGVNPTIVFEMAFSQIQVSSRYDSGLAMRFPRVVRLCPEKTLNQVDTVGTALSIAVGETGSSKTQ